MHFNTLEHLRQQMYGCFERSRDALFNWCDALVSEPQARSLPELSLSAFFERRWPRVYEALQDGRINVERLRGVFVQALLASKPADEPIWLGVVATWDIRSGNSDLDKSPCGGRGGASKIRRYHSALTHLQLAHFHKGEIYSVSHLLISIRQLVFFCLHRLQRCFLRWTKPPQASLLLGMAVDLARGKSELVAENALLRQQLIILRRQVKRPVCTRTDHLLLVLLARAVRTWRQALFLVQPETLLRLPPSRLSSLLEVQIKGACSPTKDSGRDHRLDQRHGQEQSTVGS